MASTLNGSLMIGLVIILSCQLAMSRTLPAEAIMSKKHEQWMADHGRVYENDAEKERRFKIFKENVESIEKFNTAGNQSYKQGINQFADLTKEEFLAAYTGYKRLSHPSWSSSFRYENVSADAVPPSMDWRNNGAVTPIKNQASCGSSWAFSAVAAIEGITQIKTGQLISLSEQEILDCDKQDNGCNGGMMQNAFQFVINNQGITSEANYPYTAMEGTCNAASSSPVATISGYQNVPKNNEQALMMAVANQPVSVGVDASLLQSYSGGILSGDCGLNIDHAITAVGYGTSADGTNYWILKNSWGSNWGENGYLRMQKDVPAAEGMCGIAMDASYPTVGEKNSVYIFSLICF